MTVMQKSDELAEFLKTLNGNKKKMTQQEYNAVKSFKKWEEKNGEHTYSDWDN